MSSNVTHLVLAVVTDLSRQRILAALTETGHTVTVLGSSSSLFATGFSTLAIGVASGHVEQVLTIIREHCHTAFDPGEKRGVAYVIPVESFGVLRPDTVENAS
jgi:uncharacterized protein YaaQ